MVLVVYLESMADDGPGCMRHEWGLIEHRFWGDPLGEGKAIYFMCNDTTEMYIDIQYIYMCIWEDDAVHVPIHPT